MRIVTELPRRIREVENLWIPLADGERMAARMFLPSDADSDPVPAIVEYNPYHQRGPRDLARPPVMFSKK